VPATPAAVSSSEAGAVSQSAIEKTPDAREQQAPTDPLLESAIQLLQSTKRGPAAHQIAAHRLNQYLAKLRSGGAAPIPPLSSGIKSALAGRLTTQQLQLIEAEQFDRPDSIHVEGCFLLRDAARQAVADKQGNLEKALAVFDWVVRNIQIIPLEESAAIPLSPPMVLLVGRGNEAERAWTFMELLRQAEIESAMVAYTEKSPDGKSTALMPWVPAALWDDSLYLFDTTIGLPVPGPGNQPVATLKQVLDDASLLDQLDIDPERPYRMNRDRLNRHLVLLESTPTYWAPRMRFLQENLSDKERAVLWSDLLALTGQVRSATSDDTPQDLWLLPRTAHEMNFTKEFNDKLLGSRESPIGALTLYQFFSCSEARTSHLHSNWAEAIPLYMSNRIPFQQWIAAERNQVGIRAVIANAAGAEHTKQEIMQEVAMKVVSVAPDLYASIREDCTYFLGTAKFEQHDYKAATSWMARSYLEKYPEGRWVSGARYHLGRCAEAQNDIETAVQFYSMSDNSPQAVGNLIRARRLQGGEGSGDQPAEK
jgi:hypothetical protein